MGSAPPRVPASAAGQRITIRQQPRRVLQLLTLLLPARSITTARRVLVEVIRIPRLNLSELRPGFRPLVEKTIREVLGSPG